MRALRTALFLATALVAAPLLLVPAAPASAQLGISVNITTAPPELPDYEQPPLPAEGWLWQPGFWAYGDEGYYWVPGTWVQPPQPGLLWTPGYWGYNNGRYVFNEGYWGPQVGFYGGIDYGYGYNGSGFFGGEWRGGVFAYNRAAVPNFGNVHVTNVYNRTIVNNRAATVSFNGGPHGIQARPTPQQEQFAHEHHIERTAEQTAHIQAASQSRELLASANHGHPPIAATVRPNDFKGVGVVPARGAAERPTAEPAHPAGAPRAAETSHPARPAIGEDRRSGDAARPEAMRPAEAAPRTRPEAARPPEAAPRARPEAARPAEAAPRPRPEAARPELAARPSPEAPHATAPRPQDARPAPRAAEPRHGEEKPKS